MLRAYICRNFYFILPLRNCFPFPQNACLGPTILNMSFSILKNIYILYIYNQSDMTEQLHFHFQYYYIFSFSLYSYMHACSVSSAVFNSLQPHGL